MIGDAEQEARTAVLDSELENSTHDEGRHLAIRHPLVMVYPYVDSQAEYANELLESKREGIHQAEAQGNWVLYLMLHEKPWRLQTFMEIEHHLTDEQYWHLLGQTWIEIENISEYWEAVPRLFYPSNRKVDHRHLLMNAEEKVILDSLPETVIIHRGCGPANREGWSWTLSYDQAEWFAERFVRTDYSGLLLTGECRKVDVIAYFDRADEEEIIIAPENVRVVSETAVTDGENDSDEQAKSAST